MDISPKTIEEVLKTYREKISTLPKDGRWGNSKLHYHYQGFWCMPDFLEGVMLAQDHFKALPSEIFVCSSPKSGTTWLKALTFAIVTRTRFNISTTPLLTNGPHDCVPFLEFGFAKIPAQREAGIPLLGTHIPYTSLPKSIIDSGCKIVYICREPKDAFVSMCNFASKLKSENQEEPLTLEEAFELYCQLGISLYGPYWDHVLGYWKASLEKPNKVLFIKYEDMMRDTEYFVQRMAEFMGYPFSLEEKTSGTIQKVIELCSFQNLSNLEVNKSGKYHAGDIIVENKIFFRKGEVGDWKNYLTPEMATRLDKIMEHKLNGSGLVFHDSRHSPLHRVNQQL